MYMISFMPDYTKDVPAYQFIEIPLAKRQLGSRADPLERNSKKKAKWEMQHFYGIHFNEVTARQKVIKNMQNIFTVACKNQ